MAGFLASPPMNFVSGMLKQGGDKSRFCEIEGTTIDVAFSAAKRLVAGEFIGRAVILGIRPEDFEVANFPPKQDRAAGAGFPEIVDVVESMNFRQVAGAVGAGDDLPGELTWLLRNRAPRCPSRRNIPSTHRSEQYRRHMVPGRDPSPRPERRR